MLRGGMEDKIFIGLPLKQRYLLPYREAEEQFAAAGRLYH